MCSAHQPVKARERKSGGFSDKEYKETAIKLQQILKNFGVGVTVTKRELRPVGYPL